MLQLVAVVESIHCRFLLHQKVGAVDRAARQLVLPIEKPIIKINLLSTTNNAMIVEFVNKSKRDSVLFAILSNQRSRQIKKPKKPVPCRVEPTSAQIGESLCSTTWRRSEIEPQKRLQSNIV